MDVAASAVSLIQFSIKGLKFIHQTFSAVQDGPKALRNLAYIADELLKVLKCLEKSPVMTNSQDGRLKDLIGRYEKDVTEVCSKLQKLNFNPVDKKGGKLWKSIKLAFSENSLKETYVKLQEYFILLTAFITINDSITMTAAHNSFQLELTSIHQKLGKLEVMIDDIGDAARDVTLPQKVENLRKTVEELSPPNFVPPLLRNTSNSLFDYNTFDNGKDLLQSSANPKPNKAPESEVASIYKDIKQLDIDIEKFKSQALERQHQLECLTPNYHPHPFIYREFVSFGSDYSASPTGIKRKEPENYKQTAETLLTDSEALQTFFNVHHIRLTNVLSSIAPAIVNRTVLLRLITWAQASSTLQMLWLKGPYTQFCNTQNNLTRVGLKLVNIAHESKPVVPVISFFCSQDEKRELMVAVTYALIRQLLPIVTPLLENNATLLKNRFQLLNGTKDSMGAAFLMLEEFLQHICKPLFCILDGVQLLDQKTPNPELERLLEVLRNQNLHVLLISSGPSNTIQSLVQARDILGEKEFRDGGGKEDIGRHSQKFWNTTM